MLHLLIYFYQVSGCFKINFGTLWQKGSLNHPIFIPELYLTQPKGQREPCNEVMPQILAQFETTDFQSGIWALSHCATLPYSAFAKGTVNWAFAKNDFRYNVSVFSATEDEHATRAKRRHSTTCIDTVLLPVSCLCCQNCIVFRSS